MAMQDNRWKFWIDVGGTFTDCLATDPSGQELQCKLLSNGFYRGIAEIVAPNRFCDTSLSTYSEKFWQGCRINFTGPSGATIAQSTVGRFRPDSLQVEFDHQFAATEVGRSWAYQIDPGVPAPILAIHRLTGCSLMETLPGCEVHLSTTRGTNALLTRSGAKTALVTSKGFRDFLAIGDQTRPQLFALTIHRNLPLYTTAIEIDERVLFDGKVETEPDIEWVERQLTQLYSSGIESIAICFLHGYKYPRHERLVADVARQIGFDSVRISSEVAPLIKLIPRGETTVLDAYLNPVIGDYLDQIGQYLGSGSELKLMTSAGTLTPRHAFSGKDSVLSGPAGGVVAAARIAQQIGEPRAIGFDMGGTSTDVCRFDGRFELEYETSKAGVRIMTPVMAIETVAAGGGSICRFDGTRLLVGPESAGAHPGPACYGAAGPLTITDVNLFLGRLDRRRFPFPLSPIAVEQRFDELAQQLAAAGLRRSTVEIANGLLEIANHCMAMAIRSVSVARGFDPRDYLLVSFGGAGGQHCCGVADFLDIQRILVHPKCSLLSAYGIKFAETSRTEAFSVLQTYSAQSMQWVNHQFDQVASALQHRLVAEGLLPEKLFAELTLELRYFGTESGLAISQPETGDFYQAFLRQHQQLYGYLQDRPVEIVSGYVTVKQPGAELPLQATKISGPWIEPPEFQSIDSYGANCQAGKFDWTKLGPGDRIAGPAVIADPSTSTIVDTGWGAIVLGDQQLLIQRMETDRPTYRDSYVNRLDVDPVELEIFNNSFSAIATRMGLALRKTAISVNVKERLDFSCAVFSEVGDLVVNAPHIPVHLGAMSETVKRIMELNCNVDPGDVFLTNDPYAGGSHLPDVTVVTPVFCRPDKPVFWVATRAHHAEIGGIAPGSMPALATQLGEEGILIRNFKLIHEQQAEFESLRALLTSEPYPSRSPDENIADIKAQVAANQAGCSELIQMVTEHSLAKVRAYMGHIRQAAEKKCRAALSRLPDGVCSFIDQMDDGTAIRVQLDKQGSELRIDFTGSASTHPGNLNANRAIVESAIMYVLRCLIDEDIPLNGGLLNSIEVLVPEGFLNPQPSSSHQASPAVGGGNVETSQRIVDVLFGALGLAAASQGTMNNWLIGDSNFGYYETVGGGSGATAQGGGADAVHCHMSNTRLTDPEVLESRYPVILREFAVRPDSGGQGKLVGGNGMIRELEFRQPVTLTLLTSRRTVPPFGIHGGQPAVCGMNILIRADGHSELLPSQCQRQVGFGDRLRLLTPGGGGYGWADQIRNPQP